LDSGMSGYHRIVGKQDASTNQCNYGIGLENGTDFGAFFNDGSWRTAYYSTDLNTGQWYHVVGQWDDSEEKMFLYIDGVLVQTTTIGGAGTPSGNDDPVLIGLNEVGGSEFFNGNIADVRLYDYILSADQVSSLYSGSYNVTPLHGWKLDEGHATAALNNAVGAFEDFGTGTDSHGQGADLVDASCVNGTLDLDSTLTIAANGTLSAPRGELDLAGNYTGAAGATYDHNSGLLHLSAGNDLNYGSTVGPFYDLKVTGDNEIRVLAMTIENNFTVASGGSTQISYNGDIVWTMGTDSSHATNPNNAGSITSTGTVRVNNNGSSQTFAVVGASTLYPCVITGTNFDWAYGDDSLTKFANVDYQLALTLGDGSGDATLTLTGDCRIRGRLIISSDNTLDLNGNRLEVGNYPDTVGSISDANVEGAGTITTGNKDSLLVMGGNQIGAACQFQYGGLAARTNWDKLDVIWNTKGSYTTNHQVHATEGPRTLLINGDTADKGFDTYDTTTMFAENIIVGGGRLFMDRPTSSVGGNDITCTNMTIATGGELEENSNGKTLTCSGDFTTSGGLIGKSAFDFDGASGYINCGSDSSIDDIFDGGGTFECWINADSDGEGSVARIVDKSTWNLKIQGEDTGKCELNLYYGFNSHSNYGQWTTTDKVITTGKWHHVALTYDADLPTNQPIIYVDGKQVALTQDDTPSGTRDSDAGADLFLGNTGGDSRTFDGRIAMVRLFTDIRTESELRADMFNAFADMSSTHLLAAMYQFDEGTGDGADALDDVSSNDNKGNITAGGSAWAGSGTFTQGTSTLVMSGSSKKIYYNKDETFNKLTVSGTVSLFGVDETTAELRVVDDLNISGTLASTASEYINFNNDFVSNSGTITIGGTVSGMYKFRTQHTSGTVTFPACTTPRIICDGSEGTTTAGGDLTITTELEVNAGTTFNANANTIAAKIVDVNGTGTLNLTNSTLIFNVNSTGDDFSLESGSTLTADASIITGYSSGAKTPVTAPEAGDFEVVGDVKWLAAAVGSKVIVTGSITDCTGDFVLSGHSMDTGEHLDVDLKLEGDRLDKPVKMD